jgi:hypothetical protein
MATGVIDTRPTKVGEVLKHEYVPSTGYCRREVTVTVPAGGLKIGAVLESTSVSGKYTLVANLTQADADAVLIDTRVNDDTTVGGDFTLAVLVKGPAQVRGDSLSYNADVADPSTAIAALEALGIQVL